MAEGQTGAGWVTSSELYTRKVWNEAGEEAEVTLRLLNAGDKAEVEDQQQVRVDADEETVTPEMRMGSMKHLIVNRALVSWTLPLPPPTEAIVASLDDGIFQQLFALASFGQPPKQPERPKKDGAPRPPRAAGKKPAPAASGS